MTLPSISDQLGDLNHLAKAAATGDSAFPSPPSGRTPLRFSVVPGPGTPSNSPVNAFSRKLPTPGPDSIIETPSTEKPGSPSAMEIDHMSVNGITNRGFECAYPGCTARPFITQCLLNYHANIHSPSRAYYCSVTGCSRSEGGKGFKRRNDRVRYGLAHDSPGYACPFGLKREYKYPRPGNLLRHVRAQHTDKASDDPQLRRVLSQKLEESSGRAFKVS